VGDELFHGHRQTDMTKLIGAFRNSSNNEQFQKSMCVSVSNLSVIRGTVHLSGRRMLGNIEYMSMIIAFSSTCLLVL
jgi:hypothetical protein